MRVFRGEAHTHPFRMEGRRKKLGDFLWKSIHSYYKLRNCGKMGKSCVPEKEEN